jgi:hypothetical protein
MVEVNQFLGSLPLFCGSSFCSESSISAFLQETEADVKCKHIETKGTVSQACNVSNYACITE